MYAALLHAKLPDGFDAARLRLAVCGGASLPVEVLHGFEKLFGVDVLEGYGLPETSPVAAIRDGWFHTGDLARVDEDGGVVRLRLSADSRGA